MLAIFSKFLLRGWVEKLFIVLIADYILLFGLESILPGFVMGVFNINYLLLLILSLLLYLGATTSSDKEQKTSRLGVLTMTAAGIFLIIITIFSLYKAPGWQIALYTFLSLVLAAMIYKGLSK